MYALVINLCLYLLTNIGERCESIFDPCANNPCQHGGICSVSNEIGVCTCMGGYTGTFCAIDIDECASSPCVGLDTVCQNLENQYQCICPTGMTGINLSPILYSGYK